MTALPPPRLQLLPLKTLKRLPRQQRKSELERRKRQPTPLKQQQQPSPSARVQTWAILCLATTVAVANAPADGSKPIRRARAPVQRQLSSRLLQAKLKPNTCRKCTLVTMQLTTGKARTTRVKSKAFPLWHRQSPVPKHSLLSKYHCLDHLGSSRRASLQLGLQ